MKFKKIPKEYFFTILDRLTRFEPACIRYKRVFDDIISKFSLDCKLKNLSVNDEIELVEEIFNSSINSDNNQNSLNSTLMEIEDLYFYKNETSYQYLSSRINILSMFNEIKDNKNLPLNLKWLNYIQQNSDFHINRINNALLYPIEKIILCEGQTEFILLNSIFKLFNINLDSKGILVLQAGGKNQVARKYYEMLEYVKLPFFILLDKDALSIKELIEPKLRKIDDLYLIKSGEFEDLIPVDILKNTINSIHSTDFNCNSLDFDISLSMVENLENIYKKYGFGEFKKAKFAQQLKEFIDNNCNKNDFETSEIIDIIKVLK